MNPSPARGARRRFRRGLAAATALASIGALLTTASPAAAEEQPAIVKAYGLDWIERVREEAWPQPKDRRPIICLLDTGVAVTPDTPEDNPNGPIVARLALDGGNGLPQGDTWEHRHGTDMAAVIAAPRNGYGTVGVFPQARIVSVKVTDGPETYIVPAAVRHGVQACRRWAYLNGQLGIAVVVMAESNYDQRPSDVDTWATAAGYAADLGGIFVAAAGNRADAEAVAPLAVADIVTVSAGDEAGSACGFAPMSRALEVRGPGCAAAAGWPAGSSAAAAAVGGFAAAWGTLEPGATPAQKLVALRNATTPAPDGLRRIDGHPVSTLFGGTFSPAPVVDSGLAAAAAPVPVLVGATPAADSPAREPRLALWRPVVRATWTGKRLVVRRSGRRGGYMRIQLDGLPMDPIKIAGSQGTVRGLTKKPTRITAWAESRVQGTWRSLSVRAKVR